MDVAGLLLAAGAGRRYGMPKALIERDGRLLVDHGLDTLRAAGCTPLVVVLGAAAEEVRRRGELAGAVVVVNDGWADGMGSSLRAGLAALAPIAGPVPVPAVAVLLVDTPGVTAAAVRRVGAAAQPRSLRVATYDGRPGHPVVLGRDHWSGVARLAVGDSGARAYLAAHRAQVTHVPCADIADGTDLDIAPGEPPTAPR